MKSGFPVSAPGILVLFLVFLSAPVLAKRCDLDGGETDTCIGSWAGGKGQFELETLGGGATAAALEYSIGGSFRAVDVDGARGGEASCSLTAAAQYCSFVAPSGSTLQVVVTGGSGSNVVRVWISGPDEASGFSETANLAHDVGSTPATFFGSAGTLEIAVPGSEIQFRNPDGLGWDIRAEDGESILALGTSTSNKSVSFSGGFGSATSFVVIGGASLDTATDQLIRVKSPGGATHTGVIASIETSGSEVWSIQQDGDECFTTADGTTCYKGLLATAPATCSLGDTYTDTSGAYCVCWSTDTWTIAFDDGAASCV